MICACSNRELQQQAFQKAAGLSGTNFRHLSLIFPQYLQQAKQGNCDATFIFVQDRINRSLFDIL
jgi:hypothetical protein